MTKVDPQLILIVVLMLSLGFVSCRKDPTYELGLIEHQLRPCLMTDEKLCFSTKQTPAPDNQDIKPLKYFGNQKKSREHLKLVLTRIGIQTLLQEDDHYLAYRLDGSPLKGDVIFEFHFADEEQVIHMKSVAQKHFLSLASPVELLNKISFEYYQN